MRKITLKEKLLNFCTKSKIGLKVLSLFGYRLKQKNLEVIVLVGLPGSGKSTYAKKLEKKGYIRINQDTLGTRSECKRLMKYYLSKRQSVVIDRCNFDVSQRSTWINTSKMYPVRAVKCVIFDTPVNTCIKRTKTRKGHPTIDNNRRDIDKIIMGMYNKYIRPELSEGFFSIETRKWDR